jgi:GntR family transcriptional regulator
VKIIVSTDSSVAMYEQTETQIRAAILSDAVAAGSTLPSLRALAAELRVSVITITRAYNGLVAQGLVRNEHGRGFVVLDVDPAVASTALEARVAAAVTELHAAARQARLSLTDIHDRLDETWRTHD